MHIIRHYEKNILGFSTLSILLKEQIFCILLILILKVLCGPVQFHTCAQGNMNNNFKFSKTQSEIGNKYKIHKIDEISQYGFEKICVTGM